MRAFLFIIGNKKQRYKFHFIKYATMIVVPDVKRAKPSHRVFEKLKRIGGR